MATAQTNRQLLFGILAAQMDFISREQLTSAVDSWRQDTSRPIETVLVDNGFLSENDRRLLVPLTERHIEIHDGDPSKSIAALNSVDLLAEDLRSLGDSAIGATMAYVSSQRATRPFEDTVAQDVTGRDNEASPRSTSARFHIVRPHAKGGLGEVSVAQDMELNREVALKEIQTQYADDESSRARFLLEAEVTGGLEHPGVVPVYSLGRYADGRPFYAMRFIKGDSLKDALRQFHRSKKNNRTEQALELRKLLGRFIDVCQAIEYAHSRGVLHRDLKPGNVMLGRYGETLVVDWGLAKVAGRQDVGTGDEEDVLRPRASSFSAPTQLGRAIGTPAYMSPEQAAGQIDQLGPTSDVYSLGASLYCVLTGRPPFADSDVRAVLERVRNGNFQTPRQVDPQIPSALNSICLKAMARDPEKRYSSPMRLADDVERWLADEAVVAHRETFGEQMGRWARRHRSWVRAGAVALLLIATVASVAVVMVNRERRIAQKLAVENQRRFNQVRELANTFVFDVHDAISRLKGSTPARQLVVSTALKYLDTLSQDAQDDVSLRHELATAYRRVGDIQGNDQNANLGDTTAAINSYEKALEHLQFVEQQGGNPDQVRDGLILARDRLGFVLQQQGKMTEAKQNLDQALELAQLAAEKDPHNLAKQSSLWSAINRLADLEARQGHAASALPFHQRGLQLAAQLDDRHPDNLTLQRQLGISHALVAADLSSEGRHEEALPHCHERLRIANLHVEQFPDDARALRDAGEASGVLAKALSKTGAYEEALKCAERCVEICEELAKVDPDNAQAQRDLGLAYQRTGEILQREDMLEQAVDQYRKARKAFEPLADSTNAFMQRTLAILDNKLGEALEELARPAEALECYRQALAIHQQHFSDDQSNLSALRSVSIGHQNVGLIAEALGDFETALAEFRNCVEAREKLCEAVPNSDTLKRDLAYIDKRLAWLLATCPIDELRDGDAAVRYGERGCELTDYEQTDALQKLAAAYAEAGDFAKAIETQQKAIATETDVSAKAEMGVRLLQYLARKPYRVPLPSRDHEE